MKKKVANWSNYPVVDSPIVNWDGKPFSSDQENWIPRGLGRCYGDASLSDVILSITNHNLFLSFDTEKGILTCQSGVSLKQILELTVPRGWFLPVTPGTKYVTVGGALASDVHGKNHHLEGCFGDHVLSLTLVLEDGKIITCSTTENTDFFKYTRGGMGLTGIIDSVTLRLKPIETSYISQSQIKANNLQEIISLFHAHKESTYSMAWIDCLKGGKGFGRSIFMKGEHTQLNELPTKFKKTPLKVHPDKPVEMPINLPGFTLNKFSIKAFNWLYFHKNVSRHIENTVHYDGFFYPLDSIGHWNRMYGKRGFVQYQFVLPLESSESGLIRILERIRAKGLGSFLAVLKLFGKQESPISFPMEGFTLALDFPMKKGLFEFLDELDKMVLEYGGRIYLSKDARMNRNVFWEGYPKGQDFFEFIKVNSSPKLASYLSKRLEITE